MLILVLSVSIVILTVFVFHKKLKNPVLLELVPMSWSPIAVTSPAISPAWREAHSASPINIIWDSSQQQLPIPYQAGRAVHADHEKPACFRVACDNLSSLSDSEPDIIRQKFDYFALAAPSWKEDDGEDAAIRRTRELVSPNCVLNTGDSDILMPECSEGSVLPM